MSNLYRRFARNTWDLPDAKRRLDNKRNRLYKRWLKRSTSKYFRKIKEYFGD